MKPRVEPRHIRLIRLLLLSGILLFGVVAAVVASGSESGLTLNRPGALASVVALLVIASAGAVLFVRRKLEETRDLPERLRLLLVAHALCEAAALLGGVHMIITGAVVPYVAGLVAFLFSLLLLPVEPS